MTRSIPSRKLQAAVAALTCASAGLASPQSAKRPRVEASASIRSLSGFVENRGQWDPDVLFFARAGSIDATLTQDALVFRPGPPDPETGREWPAPVILRLPGKCVASVEGEGALPTLHHFIVGSERSRWASDVRGFDHVVYRDVLPGIDLVVRVETKPDDGVQIERFAYDLVLAAGARLEDFALEVEGASGLEVVDAGATLAMATASGIVEQRIGASWQVDAETDVREPVASRFRAMSESNTARIVFDAPGRDPTKAFVLDPSLAWATYVGGSSQDSLRELDVGIDGATYLACKSWTAPTTPGAFQTAPNSSDAWAGKLSADGSTLLWATFVGGGLTEDPFGIDVDLDGTVVLVGNSWSSDYPTTAGSLQPQFVGVATKSDLFVARLTPDGAALVWSTFYGAADYEIASASALFPNGDVLVAADPFSAPPPATAGAFDTVYSPGEQLLARISADGSRLVFQTYFSVSRVLDVVIDKEESVYFAGDVSLGDGDGPLPATPGAFKTSVVGTKNEGFVAKLNGAGSQILWATYLGGNEGIDTVWGIAIDAAGAVYAAGQTTSDDLATTPGVFSQAIAGAVDGFVTKLHSGGSGLVWSTYFGTTCCDGSGHLWDLAVDSAGNVHTVGSANETSLPTTADAFQPTFVGPSSASNSYLTKFDAFGESLVYSTWYGGTNTDFFPKVALCLSDGCLIGLQSYSGNIPTTSGAYDQTHNGDMDVVIAKFDLPFMPWEILGGGKPGEKESPNLAGGGWLTPGSAARMSVRGSKRSASAILFAGASAIDQPLYGGTFVPFPAIILPLAMDPTGAIDLDFTWPSVPAGIQLYVQAWIADPSAVNGCSATNALRLVSQ